jgi:hypothetical protein
MLSQITMVSLKATAQQIPSLFASIHILFEY